MIELVNVEKTYYSKAGDIHALHKTSLSIKLAKFSVSSVFPVPANPHWFAVSICWKNRPQARYSLTARS